MARATGRRMDRLSQDLESSARGVLAEIAKRHARLSKGLDGTLAGGLTGEAIFAMVLHATAPEGGYDARAQRRLEAAIATKQRGFDAGLFTGVAGLGWAIELLVDTSDPDDDPNRGIDEELGAYLEHSAARDGKYDLIVGDVGIGLYALARTSRPAGKQLLTTVVERLASRAQRDARGAYWWSQPAWIPASIRGERQRPYVDLGLSHGIAGVVALLGRVAAAGHGTQASNELLAETASWLLAQELAPNRYNAFPAWIIEGTAPSPTRTAWCYGDPGIASALWHAGKGLGDASLCDHAVRIATGAANRAIEDSRVDDPTLCHGSTGLAHIFAAFYRVTGEPAFRASAEKWFVHAFASRKRGRGAAGFASGNAAAPSKTDTSLLTGTAGIGLAIASALHEEVPAWDEIFFVPR
jgi:lantibiotic biosynthesis protein